MMPGVQEICDLYGIDPHKSISEGTLIVMCRPNKAGRVLDALRRRHIVCAAIGEVTRRRMVLVDGDNETKLEHPVVDPFWGAYFGALEGKSE